MRLKTWLLAGAAIPVIAIWQPSLAQDAARNDAAPFIVAQDQQKDGDKGGGERKGDGERKGGGDRKGGDNKGGDRKGGGDQNQRQQGQQGQGQGQQDQKRQGQQDRQQQDRQQGQDQKRQGQQEQRQQQDKQQQGQQERPDQKQDQKQGRPEQKQEQKQDRREGQQDQRREQEQKQERREGQQEQRREQKQEQKQERREGQQDQRREQKQEQKQDRREGQQDQRREQKQEQKQERREGQQDQRRDQKQDQQQDRREGQQDQRRDQKQDQRQEGRQDRREERRDDRREDAGRRLDDVRKDRKETREGNRTVIREGNRTIIRDGDRTIIRRDENSRFSRGGRDARVERRGGETRSISVGRNGVQIVTVTDTNGRLIRRSRLDRGGREVIIIDNRVRGGRRAEDFYVRLAPPVIRIPRERYIVEADDAPPALIYETLMAPPVERIERAYTLDEVRYSPELRDRMPRIDLDTINFETGSWEVTPDQFNRLTPIADGIKRAVQANPNEVFLIEGHTDAVGSDEDNLSLSDRRAESVAVILSDEFQVPPENLTTQGYGEQQLKVPSDGPERVNRRVTIRRITPLLQGQNQAPQ